MEFLQKCGLIYPSLIYSYKIFVNKQLDGYSFSMLPRRKVQNTSFI